MPLYWNKGIILPIYKMEQQRYYDINNVTQGVHQHLCHRLEVYSEEIIVKYQCGFHKNRSN